MNSTTQETLKTLWDLSTKVVQLKAGGSDRSSFVFTAPRGGFIQNLKRYWYPALRRAGIDDFHFHDLRHTFASRAANERRRSLHPAGAVETSKFTYDATLCASERGPSARSDPPPRWLA
jgi:integrase